MESWLDRFFSRILKWSKRWKHSSRRSCSISVIPAGRRESHRRGSWERWLPRTVPPRCPYQERQALRPVQLSSDALTMSGSRLSHAAMPPIVNIKAAMPPNISCTQVAELANKSSETMIMLTAPKNEIWGIKFSSYRMLAPQKSALNWEGSTGRGVVADLLETLFSTVEINPALPEKRSCHAPLRPSSQATDRKG